MKTGCVRITAFGGPQVLEFGETDVPAPGAGEALVRHTGIGVNFVDVYHRTGQLHGDAPQPPFIPGVQANGVVEAVGPGVAGLQPGDRVTHANVGLSSYVGHRVLPAERLVRIPDALDDDLVAATYLRGLTCHYLLKRLYRVQPGDTILVHAAAGGVGQLLVQWAKRLGAVVIGTVGSDAKADLVTQLGCDHAINYRQQNFVEEVARITNGAGVPVVYDSVGADTFMGSLDCLRPMGLAINYGTASGQVPAFPLQRLHSKSLSVCRPTLRTYIALRSDLEAASRELFELLAGGDLRIDIAAKLPLAEAAQAHALLEGRTLNGTLLLQP
ncbi:quinone oxidoreductase family protein [Bordetella petrii]|uniref:quinone oxidoreductase family protein n=1 Tax=Bordetella petrii TaxID=94624 RepID=UPI001A962BA8|nr:quinone oxidoreductase [Bordetella petrii]MBO1111277.1 quinone oxidoreductase [Bordetella petrii]